MSLTDDGDQEQTWSLEASLYLLVLLGIVLAGHAIHGRRFKFATEGSVSLLAGLLAGSFIYGFYAVRHGKPVPVEFVQIDNRMFFQVLLPPIIFYAGFSVKKKLFFQNFLTIFLFGVVGTFISAATIAAGTHAVLSSIFKATVKQLHKISTPLGVVFACTDSVATLQVLSQDEAPLLYSLVFGEGVVNDATAIVLLGAVGHLSGISGGDETEVDQVLWSSEVLAKFLYLFAASLALGVAFGLLSALVVRHAFGRHHAMDREVLVVGLAGLCAYTLADGLGLSAIFSIFFCGLTISHYTLYSLSPEAQALTQHTFRIIAALCEVVLFSYAGLDMWFTALWHSDVYTSRQSAGKVLALAFSLLGLVLAGRAAAVLPLACVANLWRRHRMSLKEILVVWWAGLPRGAITLALTYHQFYYAANPDPKSQIVIAASVLVVLVTTVGFGACTQDVLDLLLWRWADRQRSGSLGDVGLPLLSPQDSTAIGAADVVYPRRPATEPLGRLIESTSVHTFWRWFDDHAMQPIFGGSTVARRRDSGTEAAEAAAAAEVTNPPPADLQVEVDSPVLAQEGRTSSQKSTGPTVWAEL